MLNDNNDDTTNNTKQNPPTSPSLSPPQPSEYDFGYGVTDDYHGTHFGHSEKRDGYRTEGQYFVDLPDGRRMIVNYYSDETGYHPTITYEGKPTYPEPKPVYKPEPLYTAKPVVYKPEPSYTAKPVVYKPEPSYKPLYEPTYKPVYGPTYKPAPVYKPSHRHGSLRF